MSYEPYKALYLHIPFCKSRCVYCDFHTQALSAHSPAVVEYIDALCAEIADAGNKGDLDALQSVYIGGGTPTHLPAKLLSALLTTVESFLDSSDFIEYTVEANPESLDEDKITLLRSHKVNRLSIGVQSLQDRLLHRLGRIHDATGAISAIRTSLLHFDNVGVDIMCGIPGQSEKELIGDIERLVELGIAHISVYPLTLEPGTPLYRSWEKGEIDSPDDDIQASQLQLADKVLSRHGFSRYEVANYARPGYECRHNMAYWTGKPYLGLGSSAVTMMQNIRRRMRVQDGIVCDDLDCKQMKAEDLMLAMRLTSGISDECLLEAADALPDAVSVFHCLERDGLVVYEQGRWKPTKRGWLCGNDLFGRILDLAP